MRQSLLITGGTGFFGRHLATALRADYDVVLGARNASQNAMAQAATGCRVLPLDVTRIESVRDAFAEVRPHIVIHAAAAKYVDRAEEFPMECVDVNVLGAQNTARVAIEHKAAVVVGVSTDKAAPPVRNTYGLSKALMERMFCNLNGKTDTRFCCVRFGNLAWSTGSVLPLWRQMHARDGVIRSTGPDMRRLICPVADAVTLIRTAIDHIDAVEGRVLSRPMKAVQIADLLATWTARKGGRWERVPARPGERDDEALIGEIELPFTACVAFDGRPHFLISPHERAACPPSMALSSANAERLSAQEMRDLIDNPVD
jgi:FlaA1/EpsC-like NDP-sugar epimerase